MSDLLNIIGPVMVGPSSSHTAGACRLGLLARHTLFSSPTRAQIQLHGSFAKTGKGHGTHLALVAGLLGCFPDDERIPEAFALAEQRGLTVDFFSKDLGDVHPNTVCFQLENAHEHVQLVGSSLGAGLVKVFKVNDFELAFTGSFHTLLIEHDDMPGAIAKVARILADDEVNIATMTSGRKKRGGRAMMSLEIDKRPAQYAIDYLANVPYSHWLRVLPEVMSGEHE